MRGLIIFLLLSSFCHGQKGLFYRNDTMWQIRGTNIGDTVAFFATKVSTPSAYAPIVKTLRDAFRPDAGNLIIDYTVGTWNSNQVLEPSFFYDSSANETKVYYTGSYDSGAPSFKNRIGLSTSSDMATFTASASNPVLGMGHGGAPATRRAHSAWAGKLGNTYYTIASNGYGYNYAGEDNCIYGYSSSDGVTWTDRGKIVNRLTAWAGGPIVVFANIGVVTNQYNVPQKINGKYVALMEVNEAGIWMTYRSEADSLMGQWTFTNKLTSLQVVAGGMYGGPCCIYVNGVYHAFYHYGANAGSLPTYLACWTKKKFA